MHPVCFEIGSLTINWYGVMMALAFLAGLASWTFLGRKEGRGYNYCTDLLFWIMVSGIVGARIAYVLKDIEPFLAEPTTILRVDQGGLVFYGGFLGSVAAAIVFARRRGEKMPAFLDFAATSVPLGHAFGRIGCFLNGCCFGREYGGIGAVAYPAHTHPWWHYVYAGKITRFDSHSVPVHAVQLYEAAYNVLLYVLLVWAYRRRKRDGHVAAAYLLAYPAGRFCFEFLRGDDRAEWLGLSVAQFLSIGLFAAGAVMWFLVRRRPHEAHSGS